MCIDKETGPKAYLAAFIRQLAVLHLQSCRNWSSLPLSLSAVFHRRES